MEFGLAENFHIQAKLMSATGNFFATTHYKQQCKLQATTFVKLFQSAYRARDKEVQSQCEFLNSLQDHVKPTIF